MRGIVTGTYHEKFWPNFDPISATITAIGAALSSSTATAIGTGLGLAGTAVSAAGTIASGNAQKSALDYQAAQVAQNGVQSEAAAQRQSMEQRQRSDLLVSKEQAMASGSGVIPSAGSPLALAGDIAGRGEYQALSTMAEGINARTGADTQAAGLRYSGDAAATGGIWGGLGTLASGFGNTLMRGSGGAGNPLRFWNSTGSGSPMPVNPYYR